MDKIRASIKDDRFLAFKREFYERFYHGDPAAKTPKGGLALKAQIKNQAPK